VCGGGEYCQILFGKYGRKTLEFLFMDETVREEYDMKVRIKVLCLRIGASGWLFGQPLF
jgi:hypothetical protein